MFLNQDVVVVKNYLENKVFLYNRNKREKSIINDDMFEILEYIYNNPNTPLENLAFNFGDIQEVLENLLTLGILVRYEQKNLCNIKRIENFNTSRLFIELTNKCNLKCKHCYGSFDINKSEHINLDIMLRLIQKAKELGVYEFDLTGGEALLYSNLEQLLKELNNSSMLVTIFTNLTFLSENVLNLLSKYNVKKIITSVDSCFEDVHDEFRGKLGSLNRTIKNIQKLKSIGIEVAVNTMVGNHNINHIKQTLTYLRTLEVPVVLDTIIPTGRGLSLNEDMIGCVRAIRDASFENDISLNISDCGVGNRFIYVKSNGDICLCPSLSSESFVFGNINKEYDLIKIWRQMKRNYNDIDCKEDCNKKDECKGGCRARAYLFNDNINSRDKNSCVLCGEMV